MKLFTSVVLIIAAFAVNCRRSDIEEKASTRNFLKDIYNNVQFKLNKEKCEKIKKSGKVPDSYKKESPIKTYGYRKYDQTTKSHQLDPATTLMLANGMKQPIRIGSRDYVVSGNSDEIIAFFECFEDYKIIGSELNGEGHWPENTGQIKIQLQNVYLGKGKYKESLFENIFDFGADALLKALDPTGIFASAYEVEQALKPFKDYLPSDFIAKAKDIYIKKISNNEKKKCMLHWLKQQEKFSKAMWKNPENVKKTDRLLMTLTMYTKPESTVRATYNTVMSEISLKEIAKILKLFFKK